MREFGDPYSYPGTRVLRNKQDIRDDAKLTEFEYEATALRAAELREKPISGKHDLAQLQATHKHLFQDVYEWAGELRTVNIAKGGSQFAQPAFIESQARSLTKELEKEGNLRGLEKPEFVDRLAYYYSEYNALHPFREGNGRATREFIGQIARDAGYELDQTRIDNAKGQWNEAARRSFHGDLEGVKQIFSDAIRPARAVAFEHLPQAEAVAKHPELKGTYAGLEAVRDAYAQRFPGDGSLQSKYLTQAQGAVAKALDAGKTPEPKAERASPVQQPPEHKNPAEAGKQRPSTPER
ncbi:putative adenosine monophosphate-protein transferase Fic [Variovorax guangxiensis]|uniref:putative adenosine monophosphate-protein transferase Fic n=1 Tax=Variovorax guangxiensis TaxID=1775474 RepID=UPI001405372D|nr:putative adenosine monophosphate-protein transferase Fic [Variovorax guangxiensis]